MLPVVSAAAQGSVLVGDVKVRPAGAAAAKPLKVGDTVAVGSTISTGANSRVVVVLTSTSSIRMGENATAVVAKIDENAGTPEVVIELKRGPLGALLSNNDDAPMNFQIKTPSGVAAARGTFFAVVVENGKGYAQVKEGVVEIVPAAANAAR